MTTEFFKEGEGKTATGSYTLELSIMGVDGEELKKEITISFKPKQIKINKIEKLEEI